MSNINLVLAPSQQTDNVSLGIEKNSSYRSHIGS
jgi:hypothetical protein